MLFLGHLSFGQTIESHLSKITSVSQAEKFIQANPKTDAKLFTIKSSNDTSEILLHLYEKKIGFVFHLNNTSYKILQIDSTLSFRAKYIYLNGENYTKPQADSLRKEIIEKYNTGTSFIDLVHEYTMDGNPNGDTNWFVENMTVSRFEEGVRRHKKNDIFTVDSPEQNWYHVVLKTHDDTFIKTVTLLRIK